MDHKEWKRVIFDTQWETDNSSYCTMTVYAKKLSSKEKFYYSIDSDAYNPINGRLLQGYDRDGYAFITHYDEIGRPVCRYFVDCDNESEFNDFVAGLTEDFEEMTE